ncbi:TetR/AcrR family transcriptional regulator [Tumebacillus sp. DT12]|uniref:TetR/AcrR family transcriptional regulator n=1 Tax=Tumebacillus lacus TaxID=2995335 RepID=A0ABT3WWY6_9BACL|nr:TetR/AcrR family transcriptional regulator [Tumebacillus lacus]MCX7569154.1 TetR/AcrR family transcriptional regulator [Tumebacillus lacus]
MSEKQLFKEEKHESRQSKQSKRFLLTALLQLLETKPYREISISEITERAGVARQTFYRNFKTKDDLITHHLEHIIAKFWETVMLDAEAGIQPTQFATGIRYWRGPDGAAIRKITNPEIGALIVRTFHRYLLGYFAEKRPLSDPVKVLERRYALKFLAGGLYIMLYDWASHDMPLPAEELAVFTHQISRSVREML